MKITDSVIRLDCTKRAYAYAVLGDGVTLIDTSLPGRGRKILRELAGHGIAPTDIRRILLTHRDPDHVGSAAYIAARSGCEVFIGKWDLPYVTGERRIGGEKGFIGDLLRVKCPEGTRVFDRDIFDGIEVVPTPVHTRGHSSFRFQNAFFAGDALSSTRNLVSAFPDAHRLDAETCAEFLRGHGISGVEWICSAHSELLHLENVIK